MNPKELIRAKRDGAPLDPDDLRALARGIADGGLTDAQVAAFAMAVFFRGLDSIELPAFTLGRSAPIWILCTITLKSTVLPVSGSTVCG